MKTTLKKLPGSQVEIEFEISSSDFDKYFEKAASHLGEHLNIDGFRKGSVPKEIIEEKVGKENLLAEAGDLAVKDCYLKVILENKLEPISQPQVEVLKLARGNPFLFKVKTTVLPEVSLPDYKKIVSQVKKKEISVSREEIDDNLKYLQKTRAKFSQLDRVAEEKDFVEIEYESPELGALPSLSPKPDNKRVKDEFILGEGGLIPGFEKNIVGMKAGEKKEFSLNFPKDSKRKDLAGREVNFKVRMITVQKVELPEINDEFAKILGSFNNLDSLKSSIKEGITIEKEMQEKQRQRSEMLERISEKVKVEIPGVLVDSEKERLLEDFKQKINRDFGITFENYLASIKQDEKTLKESFLKEAEKKCKNFLILREIGKKEDISVSDKEVEEEANKIVKNYPVDSAKKIDINRLKEYTKGVMYQEKVFQRLESFIN